ncbi:hypothetical protein T45_01047 [Streptomyces turgidiscabies]|nr:hypothetical protein T45_01047 [Streptomyces turgidiscabies]
MALTLDPDHPLPSGTVRYAEPFGIQDAHPGRVPDLPPPRCPGPVSVIR